MKTKIIIFLLALLPAIRSFAQPDNSLAKEGRALFTKRCASCHNVNKTLTGPALAGVDERRSMDWITRFVRSSQSVVKSGDKDAVALFEKFNRIPMPDQPDLTSDNIKSIVAFIKLETKTVATDAAPFSKPGKLQANYTPLSINNYGYFITFIVVILLLAGSLLALVKVKNMQLQPEE